MKFNLKLWSKVAEIIGSLGIIISLIFVAITETLFMFLIAQNYLSADPNQIKMKIIQTLDKNRCDPCKHKDCIGSVTRICPPPKCVN